ncbi:hypothetical protein A9Q95_06820 [Rhodobacterales bacterium 59_46_T64]|jgi:glycosyltransferase involved in cell wall biosynthesis|nr:hypothetical protein A9Q95_06820 [Rhodobacterales bacterium 59_46_T64]
MKITFILPYAGLSGGIRVAAVYACMLAERGHEVRVISRPPRKAPIGRRIKDALRGRRQKTLPATPLLQPLGAHHKVLERFRPVTAADVEDGDVVIATWWDTAEAVAALPASKGRKYYLLQDYENFAHLPQNRVAQSYDLGLNMLAVSEYIQDEIQRRHGVNSVRLLLNGVDTAQFTAPERDKAASLTVGFLYQHAPRKNLGLALEVLTQARRVIPDLRVIAFGRHPLKPDMPQVDGMEYEIAPPQDRIPQIYANCDAWLFTSSHEGFGLPILEAMACRTPVLATPAGAAPQIIREGENGHLLPFEAGAFVEKLAQMHAMSAPQWRQMSQSAYETAQAWNWPRACDRLEHILITDQT